ncbi:MAG: amidohydrolase family protein [Microbacterium sp.]|uniref:amidohydrolase family protein n=1 Tax=Microbacterium sp. TaxID=51671 RepID=UPI0039E3858F
MTDAAQSSSTAAPLPSPGCPPPHPSPRRPNWVLPANACDTHSHVFGPAAIFPYAADRTFTPVDVPRDEVLARQRFLGFQRSVIIQSSCYGLDHTVLLDALRSDPEHLRGAAIVTGATTTAELDELDRAGVRGARLHFMPHLGEALTPIEQRAVIDAVHARNWHVEIHVQGDGIVEHESRLAALEGRVVIDHLARVDLRQGLDSPAVRSVRRLLDLGHVWLKLSAVDRVSLTGPPYPDAVELARLFAQHAPERVLWGTDFPHPNIEGDAPDDGLLVDLVPQIAPTPAARQLLLVDNPAEVFDFACTVRETGRSGH